jgi:hypothetical protein
MTDAIPGRELFGSFRTALVVACAPVERKRRRQDPMGSPRWHSNINAILAVMAGLGLASKLDAGVGMAPIYWLD